MALPAERRPEGAAGGAVCRVPAGQGGLPIGFRFRPTDEELLLHYLRRKALSCPLPADIIPVADLARVHPSDLPGEADGERYFFHLPATGGWRKGVSAGRAGGAGVWRASRKERLVVASRSGRPVPIGAKRTLVFCRRGGARTGWAMHEYRLLPAGLAAYATAKSLHAAEPWVVCRVFKKDTPARRGTARGRPMGDADMPPSPASSCVTETRSGGGDGMDDDDDGEETASSSPRRED